MFGTGEAIWRLRNARCWPTHDDEAVFCWATRFAPLFNACGAAGRQIPGPDSGPLTPKAIFAG
jgi:hypothetical protein